RGEWEPVWERTRVLPLKVSEMGSPLYEWERARVLLELMLLEDKVTNARAACEKMLEELDTHHIDLYYVAFLILYARTLEAQRNAPGAQADATAQEIDAREFQVLQEA